MCGFNEKPTSVIPCQSAKISATVAKTRELKSAVVQPVDQVLIKPAVTPIRPPRLHV